MRYWCPRCGQIYEEMTQDGMCEQSDCYGQKLVEYTGGNVEMEDIIEGLCLLVCDASSSMDDYAFQNSNLSKLKIMTNAVHQAVTELFCISRPDRAFIGIIAYGARAALIPDKHGNPFLLSLRKIQAQLGKNLGQYLYDCVQNDIAGVNRYYSVLW